MKLTSFISVIAAVAGFSALYFGFCAFVSWGASPGEWHGLERFGAAVFYLIGAAFAGAIAFASAQQ